MSTWDDARRIVLHLPETAELSGHVWQVRAKTFALERPLRRADLAYLGDDAPVSPPLVAHVPDVGVKEALLASAPEVYFTTPHFDGYPMVLVRLDVIDPGELEELLTEAWLARAPKLLARRWLTENPGATGS